MQQDQERVPFDGLGSSLAGLYTFETDRAKSSVIDMALQSREAYLAVHYTDKPSGDTYVYAGVCLLDRDGDGVNVRTLGEFAGPQSYTCPKRILKLLSDTDAPTALAWRGRCLEALQLRENSPAVHVGDVLRFRDPVRFVDGAEFQVMRYEGANTWRGVAQDGQVTEKTYSHSAWRNTRFWEVISPANAMAAETTWDFNDGRGFVPAHRHPNGGGLVAETAWVDPQAYVSRDASVGGYARVYGKVRVEDNARVYGNAVVQGRSVVKEDARVAGDAQVADWATIQGAAKVLECGRVEERAVLEGQAVVRGNALVKGQARLSGRALATDCARLWDQAALTGKGVVKEGGMVSGQALVSDRAIVAGRAAVTGTAQVTHTALVNGDEVLGGTDPEEPAYLRRKMSR